MGIKKSRINAIFRNRIPHFSIKKLKIIQLIIIFISLSLSTKNLEKITEKFYFFR
jgi:hypothetical protein